MLWTDSTLRPIYDNEVYTAPDGTKYPHNFPKSEIPWLSVVTEVPALSVVTETPRPEDKNIVVTGFRINADHVQVWDTRLKTDQELFAEKKSSIRELENEQTPRRIREAILGLDAGWLANLETEIALLRKEF